MAHVLIQTYSAHSGPDFSVTANQLSHMRQQNLGMYRPLRYNGSQYISDIYGTQSSDEYSKSNDLKGYSNEDIVVFKGY